MLPHFRFRLLENWHLWKWKAQLDISQSWKPYIFVGGALLRGIITPHFCTSSCYCGQMKWSRWQFWVSWKKRRVHTAESCSIEKRKIQHSESFSALQCFFLLISHPKIIFYEEIWGCDGNWSVLIWKRISFWVFCRHFSSFFWWHFLTRTRGKNNLFLCTRCS